MGNIIVGVVLILIIGLAIRSIYKNKKSGGGCDGNCGNCGGCH